ncbi:MarR family winged helix-turn-helix transcriptional regulator [Actinomadura algeriensis]|uniref:DNA-binding MarR family transcriptional regulator n=1 Tax=Actinomadura algeriensis TaxID=1679523 RepID=A0ABR9K1I0_9ACTN|nr:MarR family winged helix-turn-helix transcriptional regulator [Actinomadura algeriensis]MBE1536692.1 DNA-binding MarR family transcriptional regulator [Actinomadura algeriensis]
MSSQPFPPSDGPNTPEPGTDLRTFATLLRRVNSELGHVTRGFARDQGLHHSDVQALAALLDGIATTPGQLQRHLGLTSGAISACLRRLETGGHIERVRDTADARVVRLRYTESGRALARAHFRPLARATEHVLAGFGEDELRTIARFLEALADGVEQERDGR